VLNIEEGKIKQFLQQNNPYALGKLLREIENRPESSHRIMRFVYGYGGKAHVIGITGPPGVGKSTLIEKLAGHWAEQGLEIGVLCIDPTSPFSGGALLGDRIRMQNLTESDRVFIKSLASRDAGGGMPIYAFDMIKLFEAFGKDIVLVETVGTGQLEFRISEVADTVALVTGPGTGDAIQTIKAGIMEIAELYIVNQSDRPGSEETVRDLKMMVSESVGKRWVPPVLETTATKKRGITELSEELSRHKKYLESSGLWQERRRERNRKFFTRLLFEHCWQKINKHINHDQEIRDKISQVEQEKCDPYSLLHEVLSATLKIDG